MFIASCIAQNESTGPRNYGIRHVVDGLIGGIGQHYKYGKNSHKDEIGYWLTPDHWGNGLMTKAVGSFVDEIIRNRQLTRIEAPVFQGNLGSARVLEKNGFVCEGIMRNCFKKNDVHRNGLLYAKIIE
jgi:RimJ/RimL family protein N-acetyltransferase